MVKKTAFITGASSGIGLATSRQLIENNYEVVGVARNFAGADKEGMNAIEIDLSDLDRLPSQLVNNEAINKAFDVLVLNAGYGRFGGIEQFSHEQIRHLLDTNLTSNLFLIKHFLPKLKQQGGGDIFIIGSESGLQGAKAGSVYCASKFALRGLAQSLRADCSTANIRVVLVNPGPVATDFFEELNFEPVEGEAFSMPPESVADAIWHAHQQPSTIVMEEINIQPLKRSFKKK